MFTLNLSSTTSPLGWDQVLVVLLSSILFLPFPGVPRILQQDNILLQGAVSAPQAAGLSVWV